MDTLATAVLDGPTDDHPRSHARRRQRRSPAAPIGTVNIWLPWRCRNWPSTPAEERHFVADLAHRADPLASDADTRSDVTAVLNALRGGLTADQLIERVPGLPPHRLLAAYRNLEGRRAAASAAWFALAADGTPDALADHAGAASLLVPVLVERLCASVELGLGAYRSTITRLATHVEATHRTIEEIETALALWPEQAVELGARLYDPYGDALTNRVDHLAQRVGTLTPTRVAALLGEAPTGSCPPGQ